MIKFTQKEVSNIIDLYENGASSPKIAKEYNVSMHKILRLLKKHNIKKRSNKECQQKSLSTKQINNLCSDYLSGIKTSGLSKKYNISQETARRYLSRNNIERIIKLTKDQEQDICADYISGIVINKLLQKYNIPETNFYRLLRKHGPDSGLFEFIQQLG